MPKKLPSSVEVEFLDNEVARAALEKAAEALVESDGNVKKIYLFGSLADGSATPESDADVLIVVRKAGGRFFNRADDYREYFDGLNLAIYVELFVYTEEEIGRMLGSRNDFIKTVLGTGVVLSRRPD